MMYMNTTSSVSFANVNRFDYSSESTNETSLIAKSMSWNYSGEVNDARPDNEDNAGKRENDEIADIRASNAITENKRAPERKDNENIAGKRRSKGTADRRDDNRIADNTDNASVRSTRETDSNSQPNENHVTRRTADTGDSQETGHVIALKSENHTIEIPLQCSLEGHLSRGHPAVTSKEDSNLRRTVELAAAHAAKPRSLSLHQSEKPHEVGKATVTRCILATSRYIWLPICQPNRGCRHSEVMDDALVAAAECVRWHLRRNALCDHMVMPMTQETRERIEKDVAERKTSVTRKVSQYLKAAFNSSNYEVDLI